MTVQRDVVIYGINMLMIEKRLKMTRWKKLALVSDDSIIDSSIKMPCHFVFLQFDLDICLKK